MTAQAKERPESEPWPPDASSRMVFGKDDALFGAIEEQQGSRPFGTLLDAGTGLHSLRWLATLPSKGMKSFTAVTADTSMQRQVEREAEALGVEHLADVVVGNWFGETADKTHATSSQRPLRFTQKYDTILADYLIGAMDGFSPYKQDEMLPKLADLLKPGGRLYIVGLEPIPDKIQANGDEDDAANIICRVRQVRDACILLAGHRCYREYPLSWMERQVRSLSAEKQLDWVHSSRHPILYRQATIVKQINVARSKFKFFESPSLVGSMKAVLDDLECQSAKATARAPDGRIRLGFDYIVTAEKRLSTDENNNNNNNNNNNQTTDNGTNSKE